MVEYRLTPYLASGEFRAVKMTGTPVPRRAASALPAQEQLAARSWPITVALCSAALGLLLIFLLTWA